MNIAGNRKSLCETRKFIYILPTLGHSSCYFYGNDSRIILIFTIPSCIQDAFTNANSWNLEDEFVKLIINEDLWAQNVLIDFLSLHLDKTWVQTFSVNILFKKGTDCTTLKIICVFMITQFKLDIRKLLKVYQHQPLH